jgi:hypothetical protein
MRWRLKRAFPCATERQSASSKSIEHSAQFDQLDWLHQMGMETCPLRSRPIVARMSRGDGDTGGQPIFTPFPECRREIPTAAVREIDIDECKLGRPLQKDIARFPKRQCSSYLMSVGHEQRLHRRNGAAVVFYQEDAHRYHRFSVQGLRAERPVGGVSKARVQLLDWNAATRRCHGFQPHRIYAVATHSSRELPERFSDLHAPECSDPRR